MEPLVRIIGKFFEDVKFLRNRFGLSFVENLNSRRTFNLLNSYIARRFGVILFKPLRPVTLFVEVVRGCNLSCVMCPADKFVLKMMSFEDFKMILDEFDDAIFVYPYGVGEPFLNRDIYRMIEYAVQRNFFIIPFTNFLKVDIDKLIRSGVKYVFASIDSADPDRFSQIRRNGDLGKFISNLKMLSDRKNELGLRFPRIGFSITLLDQNIDDVEKVIELGLLYGVDTFFLQTLFKVNSMDLSVNVPTKEQIEKVVQVKKRYRGKAKVLLSSHYDYEKGDLFTGYCLFAYTSIFIDVDGKVFPCTCAALPSKRYQNIGGLRNLGKTLMNRDEFLSKFRKARPDYCDGCPVYYRDF